MNFTIYPCDRGIPGNVGSRGYHHFQDNGRGVVCCVLCGAMPSAPTTGATKPSPFDPAQRGSATYVNPRDDKSYLINAASSDALPGGES